MHFLCRNLCFVTYKREDLFNLFDGGDNKEIVDIAVKVKEDKLSLNPLMLLSTWKDRPALMTKMLELGADPKCKDGEGRTCLHLAANNDSSAAVEILMKEKVCLWSRFFRDRYAFILGRMTVCIFSRLARWGGGLVTSVCYIALQTYERIIKQKRYFPPSPSQQTGRIFNRKLKPESCLSSQSYFTFHYLF